MHLKLHVQALMCSQWETVAWLLPQPGGARLDALAHVSHDLFGCVIASAAARSIATTVWASCTMSLAGSMHFTEEPGGGSSSLRCSTSSGPIPTLWSQASCTCCWSSTTSQLLAGRTLKAHCMATRLVLLSMATWVVPLTRCALQLLSVVP